LPGGSGGANVSGMDAGNTPRHIGLGGAVFTLVGYVIGASIFILPGQLAAQAGPGAFLAYLLAGVVAAIACVVGAAIGSAVPASGAVNVAAARVVAPVVGFLGVWVTLGAVVVSVALVGYGLADYLAYFAPGVPKQLAALVSVAVFGLLNVTTVRLAVSIQVAMTLVFLLVMVVFGVGGVANARPELLTPMLPNGFAAVLSAAVLAFFSFAGSTVITEIGGEIKEPGRNIPLALLIGFVIVLVSYALVALAVPALLPWQSLGDVEAPVARAAEQFLPAWAGGAIAIAAILAAATSINGMLLIHSRDLLAMARARVFPERLAARREGSGAPAAAVASMTLASVGAVLIGGTIQQYAMFAVMAVMLLQIFMAITLLRLPARLPDAWRSGGFVPGAAARVGFSVALILVSLGFMGLGVTSGARVVGLFLGFVALGLLYYRFRRDSLRRSGHDIDEVLRTGASAEGAGGA